MARGSKEKDTPRQKRTAKHIERSARKRGASGRDAKRVAWATVSKEDGQAGTERKKSVSASTRGGSSSGRGRSTPARKGKSTVGNPRKATSTSRKKAGGPAKSSRTKSGPTRSRSTSSGRAKGGARVSHSKRSEAARKGWETRRSRGH